MHYVHYIPESGTVCQRSLDSWSYNNNNNNNTKFIKRHNTITQLQRRWRNR